MYLNQAYSVLYQSMGATKHRTGLTDRTGGKLPHPNSNRNPNLNPNPSAAAAMLEVVVLGASAVISCQCGQWGRCGVSSHRQSIAETKVVFCRMHDLNVAACVQHVVPRCEWLLVMAVGRASRDYNLCLYDFVGFSDYNYLG